MPDKGHSQLIAALTMAAALMAALSALWQATAWQNRRRRAQSAELLEEYQLTPLDEQVRLALIPRNLSDLIVAAMQKSLAWSAKQMDSATSQG